MNLVLASSSTFRAQLLARLNLPFSTASPEIDESARTDETPLSQVARLALEKATVAQQRHPTSVLIGSDQMAILKDQVLGKPGNIDNAKRQLMQVSGQKVQFLTSVCVLSPESAPMTAIDITSVWFRDLTEGEIERYIALDNPIHCAGSFKAESAGMSLFSKWQTNDPDALIGLPLITVAKFLRCLGWQVP